jgi:putative transposase
MKYDPKIHKRRTIRLKGFDYSGDGMYHIVIRTKNGVCVFGKVDVGEMKLSPSGEIAKKCWKEIPEHFRNVELDQYVVMPNHIHGIVVIKALVRAIHESPIPESSPGSGGSPIPEEVFHTSPPESPIPETTLERRRMLIPKIVGRFKMNSAKEINGLQGTSGTPFWQRGYYEHVIREGKDLDRIRQYILDNPANWTNDENFPENIRYGKTNLTKVDY